VSAETSSSQSLLDALYVQDADLTLYLGDCVDIVRALPAESIAAVVTSPPYMDARGDYEAFDRYSDLFDALGPVVTDAALFNVGRIWRAGVERLWWLSIVDAARGCGWSLLDTLVWIKPNANPIHGQLFADRHEYVLIFGRSGTRLNEDAVRVPYAASSVPRLKRGWTNHIGVKGDDSRARGRRSSEPHPLGGRPPSYVTFHTGGEKGNPHPAPMPAALAEHLVKLSTFAGQTVLDPFFGSGTSAIAARKLGRSAVGIESRADYCAMAAQRLAQQSVLAEGAA
jgi:DNA modification methylase